MSLLGGTPIRAEMCARMWTKVRRAVPVVWVDMFVTAAFGRSLLVIRGLEFALWMLLMTLVGADWIPASLAHQPVISGHEPLAVAARLLRVVFHWAIFRLVVYPLNGIATFLALDFLRLPVPFSSRWLPVLCLLPVAVVYVACELLEESVKTVATAASLHDDVDVSTSRQQPSSSLFGSTVAHVTVRDVSVRDVTVRDVSSDATTAAEAAAAQCNNNASRAPLLLAETSVDAVLPLATRLSRRLLCDSQPSAKPISTASCPLPAAPPPAGSVATFAQKVASAIACVRRQLSLRVCEDATSAAPPLAALPLTTSEWDSYLDRYWRIHQILPPPTDRASRQSSVVWSSSKALGEEWSVKKT